ncbi:MAG: type I methionyl aminopeptidase [Candidatus Hydrogenedentes bacterium]|nr:type I methionyl aminopeptidase [Candidatus Hydrogenedentota bacterium]
MIALRTEKELDLLRQANQIVAQVLAVLAESVRPGVTTESLDAVAEREIRAAGGRPSFLGYHGFPKSTCISIDEEVVHGIPGPRLLKEGQIVSIDVGVKYKGYHGDAALTVACGEINEEKRDLMETTNRALAKGIAAARAGNYLEDISRAVQQEVESAGMTVVKNFVGHGIGTRLHEEPQIPNFVTGARGPLLRAGMVLAIEPMVNAGADGVQLLEDGWTAVTADGRPSAHYEHSIAVCEGEPDILSASPVLAWGLCEG